MATLSPTFLHCNGTSIANYATSKTALRRSLTIHMMASSNGGVSTMESYEKGSLERPKWSGETPMSRLVGALISFKRLYSVMKFGARQAFIRKGDLQQAEEYCFRLTKVSPDDGEILSQYAILLWELHRNQQRASKFFKLAAQTVPYDSNVLAAYAKFLWEIDDDEADDQEELQTAVHFHPADGIDSADAGNYNRMTEKNHSDPLYLKNYAQFLYQSKRDLQGAEEHYSRFLSTNPPDGEMLLQYATLLWELYHDRRRTLSYMKLAVQASPEDCNILAAYAHFLWSVDDDDDDDDEE